MLSRVYWRAVREDGTVLRETADFEAGSFEEVSAFCDLRYYYTSREVTLERVLDGKVVRREAAAPAPVEED